MQLLTGVRAFLASVTGMVMVALVAALIVQTARIEGFKVWPISHKGLKAELADLKRDLANAIDAAERQRETTKATVAKVREGAKRVEPIAKRIETAPLPGNCKTPNEIMGADL